MKTLVLKEFIQKKSDGYQEPARKGTPRGEPVGFSKVKYITSLWMMTNLTLKEVAKKTGVSYGLVRKWHIQESFLQTVKRHCDEFAGLFIEYIRERYKERRGDNGPLPKSIGQLESGGIPETFFAGLLDCHFYGTFLVSRISLYLGSSLRDAGDIAFVYTAVSALEHLITYTGGETQQSLWGLNILKSEHIKEVKLGLLERAKEIILKPGVTKTERELAASILSVLEDMER